MSGQQGALLLTVGVHVAGLVLLVLVIVRSQDDSPDPRAWWRDDGDDDSRPGDEPPAPSHGGLPLPDAAPSAVRLRAPGRIAAGYERHERRPAHAPAREPSRYTAPPHGKGVS